MIMAKCPICRKEFKSLMSHIVNTHDMKIVNFRKKYPDIELVSGVTRNKISKTSKKRGCGRWNKGKALSEEHKKKTGEAVAGEKNPFYGKKHREDIRKKMSRNHADFHGENNPLVKWLKDPKNMATYQVRKFVKEQRDAQR